MKNNKSNHTEDKAFSQLFKQSFKPDDVPSADFNRKVMDRVMNDWVSQPRYFEPLVDKQNRWWIIPGIIAIFVIGFLFDIGQITNSSEQNMINGLSEAFSSLYSWVEPIHLLIIGGGMAAGLLLFLDRLFQKLSNI